MLAPAITDTVNTLASRGVIPKGLKDFWEKWELKCLVLFSLFLQISLALLGKLRKRNGKPWLRFTVWVAYLLADWIATIALGVIFKNVLDFQKKSKLSSDELMIIFWTPFLLFHLGGPDTITAYSLEDNQLWQRRLVELLAQLIVTLAIFLMASSHSYIFFLTIAMSVAGIIKFSERIHALRLASTEQFRFSLLTEPEPGPNYPKFMEEFTLKKAEGFCVKAVEMVENPLPSCVSSSDNDEDIVLKANKLFQVFKRLFVDLILTFQDRDESQCYFHNLSSEKAFKVIEIELGFAYDIFYTKAPVVYNQRGLILRLITVFVTLTSLVIFFIKNHKNHEKKMDIIITYLLLWVTLILEVCPYLIILFSDWSYGNTVNSWFRNILRQRREPRQRWSNMIAQYSIQDFCREEKSSVFPKLLKFFMADNKVDEMFYLTYNKVSSELKDMIFKHFLKISKCNNKSLTVLCMSRGKRVLEENDCSNLEVLNWSITGVEFDQSILIWHIATELCYYSDKVIVPVSEREASKLISEYMLYLLALCPYMLPMGIGLTRIRDTCAEAREFFKERTGKPDKAEACKMLLRVNTEIAPGKVKGDRSKSVLFDACRVATELRSMGDEVKWQIISLVWIEMLAYAACHCRGIYHAQQLRKGGEFLTHVWLLMAHLGITEQFQISQGHARAKLSAK